MRPARLRAAFLLLAAAPAAAETLYTEPRFPVDSYPTRAVIDTTILHASRTSTSMAERQGNVIKIYTNAGGCVITCDPIPAPSMVDLGVLPAGDYEVQLWITADGPASGFEYHLESFPLRVEEGPRLSFLPPHPEEGEAVTLRIENLLGQCPRASAGAPSDFKIEVAAVLQDCIDPPGPATVEVPLGNLAAGAYQVELIAGQPFAAARLEVLPAVARLQDGRFEVAASWQTAAGETGPARLVQLPSSDSALFYFFGRDNWELMVKVLDGCAINGHYWVFSAASTDVAFTATVTEAGGETFEIGNLLGQPAAAINSVAAFPCNRGET